MFVSNAYEYGEINISKMKSQNKVVFVLSVILGIMIILISLLGLFGKNIYSNETVNWGVQLLLLKKKTLGLFLTPVILVFTILMDITIAGLIILMKIKGLEANLSISFIISLFTIISTFMLSKFLNSIKF